MVKNTDIKLKGHGSFYLREGWLRKGLLAIENETFSKEKEVIIDELGVGSNMVPSVKYWLKAFGIAEDKKGANKKNYLKLTNEIGVFIKKYDPYLEEIGTFALMHYKLINNFKMATSFFIIFNDFNVKNFSKQEAEEYIVKELTRLGYTNLALSSIDSDVQCLIKTYMKSDYEKQDISPEINNVSPFSVLELISKNKDKKGQAIYSKNKIKKSKLDKLIFLYIILDKAMSKNTKNISTSIENLIDEDGNVGKLFNFDRNDINKYLDELSDSKYLRVVRTAGLNQIYFDVKELSLNKILEEYYIRGI